MAYYIFDDAIALAPGGDGAVMSLEPREGLSSANSRGRGKRRRSGLVPFASAWRGIPRAPDTNLWNNY